jgi:hypothetical protein
VDLSGGGAYGLEFAIEPDLAAPAAPHFCVVVVCGARGVNSREFEEPTYLCLGGVEFLWIEGQSFLLPGGLLNLLLVRT